jgi:hypothetical protein
MTATRVIAFRLTPPAPPPCAEVTLLSASTVSVATADLQGHNDISARVSIGLATATWSSIAAVPTIRQSRRPPLRWARR